eukprot:gene31164-35178_t
MPRILEEESRAVLERSVDDLGPATFEAGDNQGAPLPEKWWDRASGMSVSYGGDSEHRFAVDLAHARGEAEGDVRTYCEDGLADGSYLECGVDVRDDGAVVITNLWALRPFQGGGFMVVTADELATVAPDRLWFEHRVKVIKSETFVTYVSETLKAPSLDAAQAAFEVPVADLAELGRLAHFRPDLLPAGFQPELVVTRHYAQRDYPFVFTNGVQASHVEVDVDTGFVRLLRHWVVEDCGRVLNPMLVDEQIRGAVVQGIGGVLYEECLYDDHGLMRNGSMADYLVPMAFEMPDIEVAHIETPTRTSQLGAKGAGEAGTAGAPAAVLNAINDALRPFGAHVSEQPVTPEKVLRALGRI